MHLIKYTYDSIGRMLTRESGAVLTQFTWDAWHCVREVTGTDDTVYHIPNGSLQSFSVNGDVYQVHLDALGSVRMITDSTGAVVARFEFGAYGEEIFVSAIPALQNFPYRFVGAAGCRTDAETGLVYMRARHYDPSLQRFIRRDALMADNRYTYASNRPTVLVDTNGLESTMPGGTDGTPLGGAELGGGIYTWGSGIYHNYGPGDPILPLPKIPKIKYKKPKYPPIECKLPKEEDPYDHYFDIKPIKFEARPNRRPSPPPPPPPPGLKDAIVDGIRSVGSAAGGAVKGAYDGAVKGAGEWMLGPDDSEALRKARANQTQTTTTGQNPYSTSNSNPSTGRNPYTTGTTGRNPYTTGTTTGQGASGATTGTTQGNPTRRDYP